MSTRIPANLGRVLLVSLLPWIGSCEPRAGTANVSLDLIAERVFVSPAQPLGVGLRMKIRRGWHTYWRNPGDSGMAPRVSWGLPEGFRVEPMEWPAPERIPEGELTAYGYTRDVVFPVRIVPPPVLHADSVRIIASVEWLECKDVCLPASAVVALDVPVSRAPAPPGPGASLLQAARSRVPEHPSGWSFAASAGPRGLYLSFVPPSDAIVRGAYFYADRPLVVEPSGTQRFERTSAGFRVILPPAANAPGIPKRLTGVLVVEGDRPRSGRAVQVDVPVAARGSDPVPAALLHPTPDP